MLSPKEFVNRIADVFEEDESEYVLGEGVIDGTFIQYGRELLENMKDEIASYLQELGISEKDNITLEDFTKYADGTTWNALKTPADYWALEYLVSISHACGFIHKTVEDVKRTYSELGEDNAILFSVSWDKIYKNGKVWAKAIKKYGLKHVHYSVRKDLLNNYKLTQ